MFVPWTGIDAEDIEIAKATLARTLSKIKPRKGAVEDVAGAR